MATPVNKNATKEVKAVLDYLEKIKGQGVIVGQHTQTMAQEELWHLEKVTGKLPALCGFELLAYSPNIVRENCDEAAWEEIEKNQGTLQCAYEWAEKGGLLTFKDFACSERFTTEAVFKEQFNHPYAITLEKLPKLFPVL